MRPSRQQGSQSRPRAGTWRWSWRTERQRQADPNNRLLLIADRRRASPRRARTPCKQGGERQGNSAVSRTRSPRRQGRQARWLSALLRRPRADSSPDRAMCVHSVGQSRRSTAMWPPRQSPGASPPATSPVAAAQGSAPDNPSRRPAELGEAKPALQRDRAARRQGRQGQQSRAAPPFSGSRPTPSRPAAAEPSERAALPHSPDTGEGRSFGALTQRVDCPRSQRSLATSRHRWTARRQTNQADEGGRRRPLGQQPRASGWVFNRMSTTTGLHASAAGRPQPAQVARMCIAAD